MERKTPLLDIFNTFQAFLSHPYFLEIKFPDWISNLIIILSRMIIQHNESLILDIDVDPQCHCTSPTEINLKIRSLELHKVEGHLIRGEILPDKASGRIFIISKSPDVFKL